MSLPLVPFLWLVEESRSMVQPKGIEIHQLRIELLGLRIWVPFNLKISFKYKLPSIFLFFSAFSKDATLEYLFFLSCCSSSSFAIFA